MDGINGITAGYSLAVLIPLALVNMDDIFVEQSLIISTILASLVFCIFNFRPKGKAKCFAGDVGSIGIAFIILFLLGNVMIETTDITWLIFLLVYGVDGCLTIVSKINPIVFFCEQCFMAACQRLYPVCQSSCRHAVYFRAFHR